MEPSDTSRVALITNFAAVLDVYPGMFRLDREASDIGRLEHELEFLLC